MSPTPSPESSFINDPRMNNKSVNAVNTAMDIKGKKNKNLLDLLEKNSIFPIIITTANGKTK